jgi:NitT/TauT family transport system permease protein
MKSRAMSLIGPPLLLGLVFGVAWQLIVEFGNVPQYVAPSPTQVVQQIGDQWSFLWPATKVSGTNALVGLITGSVWATIVAVIARTWRPVDGVFGALAAGLAAAPIVALAPLAYNAFSATSEFPRQLVVTAVVFFPIYINVSKGLRQVEAEQRALFYCNAATWWETTRLLRIPIALPYLFTGLRLAAPSAVIVAIVSEYFGGGQNGLANLIMTTAQDSSYAQAWAYVAGSIVLGLVAFIATATLELLVKRRLGGSASTA